MERAAAVRLAVLLGGGDLAALCLGEARSGLREVHVLAAQDRLHRRPQIGFRHERLHALHVRRGRCAMRIYRAGGRVLLRLQVERLAFEVHDLGDHDASGDGRLRVALEGHERLRRV